MAKVQSLTAENLDTHSEHASKRNSIYARECADVPTAMTTNPSMRRMSRFEPRQSVQYGRRMSQISRASVTGSSLTHKPIGLFPVKLQNTYKLQPDPSEIFKSGPVRELIQEILDECLDGEVYKPGPCRNLSSMLADLIKSRLKENNMGCNRYKYIVTVTIGENGNQGVHVVSRCLWNQDTDNYAEAHYNKNGIFAVGTVYACYFE